ncbi:PadR family transcriptional regulator [Vaginella massiliensis]|uniref:PadR family transcriptional regulator n=1 Tax=Vaginella massiliensis TaxID=1816680 RepID=UPI0008386895|nr:PadR family transcriptional regulator [Vaginella massiliensis]
MSVEKIQVQMRKGVLEYCILSIIKRGDAYASDIIDELKKAEMIVVEGTLYPLLTRLKNDNFLQYRWEESTLGPPRKYYALTAEGEQFLSQLASTWDRLQEAVNKVTRENYKNG